MKLHDYLQQTKMPVKAIKFVHKLGQSYRSVLSLTVMKDGSLELFPTPYFLPKNWRWGHYDVPPGRVGKVNVPIIEETLRRKANIGPKISYHTSGAITLGLKGHIQDDIPRHMATPLADVNGHFFTMMVKGMDQFKLENVNKKDYLYLQIPVPESIKSMKIVGYLGDLDTIADNKEINHEELLSGQNRLVDHFGKDIEISLFSFKLPDGTEKWVKFQFWPDFTYNPDNPAPSLSLLTGWRQDLARDPNSTIRCVGIIGG